MTAKERQELARELEHHRGRWVVVRGTRVIASDPSLEKLKQTIELEPGDRRLAVRARHGERYLRR